MRIHTSAELRAIDAHAASTLSVPVALLMENAGRAVADAARAELGERGRVFVACGRGHNGGDGWVAARHLRARGLEVLVRPLGDVEALKGEPLAMARAAGACGVLLGALDAATRGDVVIDAIFGTGLTRAPEGEALTLIREVLAARSRGARVVSVDVPSGLDADRPHAPGEAVQADVTVALHALKPAHVQFPARGACGEVRLEGIGIPAVFAPGPVRRFVRREDVAGLLPARAPDAHKGTGGHVLVVAGSPGKSGAAMLACTAALRAGAGLVTLASAPEVIDRVLPAMPEVMGFAMPVISGDLLLEALERKSALVVGPGIARTEHTGSVLVELVRHLAMPVLVDADGLNALAENQHALAELNRARTRPVLTPHPAELARLLGTTTAEVQADRLAAASLAAERFRAHVVLKGACSVVAHPDGSLEVNSTGNPALATAGTGDVLSGVGGALLANGVEPGLAALLATWAHGRAGDLAAGGLTRGLIASDVVAALPRALAELS